MITDLFHKVKQKLLGFVLFLFVLFCRGHISPHNGISRTTVPPKIRFVSIPQCHHNHIRSLHGIDFVDCAKPINHLTSLWQYDWGFRLGSTVRATHNENSVDNWLMKVKWIFSSEL